MGIDVYMKWDGFNQEDKEAQLKGFDATIGHTGYLREAYHGGPYATMYLCQEGFEDGHDKYSITQDKESDDYGYVRIAGDLLIDRLPTTIKYAIERNLKNYNTTFDQLLPYIKAFIDFVGLYIKMEREGKNPRIYVSH